MKKLLYLANLRLPTEKAYGIQIAKMCEAFASLKVKSKNEKVKTENIDLELTVPYRRNPIKKDVFEYYSVKKTFKIKKLPAIDFYFPGKLDKTAVGLKNFISAVILSFYVLFSNADIIYSRDELVLFILSFFRGNIVFEAHRFSPKRKFFYSRFKKKGTKIIAISQSIKNDLVKAGYEPNKILVAHDGVDLGFFDMEMDQENARKQLNLLTDKKIVLYSGHLFEWKGASVLLEAARIVRDGGNVNNSIKRSDPSSEAIHQFEQLLFVFVGGTDYDIKKFRKKAEGLNNVLILGHKPHREIPAYLKAADVLVLPNSAKDTISGYTSPLKLFEYMASGRPIVASGLSSIKEILNGQNAILVVPDDPESLKEGISQVLKDGDLGYRLSQRAKEDVKKFTWIGRAEKIINFIG